MMFAKSSSLLCRSLNAQRMMLMRNGMRGGTTTTTRQISGPGISPSLLRNWYNIIGKSNATYILWIITGVVTFEFLTSTATDMAWASANAGKTYESVDWTKFKTEDDEDEDEDDDDDEEEEGGDEDEEDDDDDDDDEDDDDE